MSTLQTVDDFQALGFDPAPGDLGRVDTSAEQYGSVSKQLGFAMNAIESIIKQQGVWEGEASEAFARRVGDLPEYLGKATDSMSKAASALDQWSSGLGDMKRHARELEMRAREARQEAEQARNNPAFGLANQTFTDPESLRAAQRMLDEAARQLTGAIDNLDAIIKAAERLQQQHTELAEQIADLLRRAKDIAPDEPGWLEGALDALGDWAADKMNDLLDLAKDAIQAVGDFIEDNANLIAAVSTILGDISTVIGVVADFLPPPADSIVGGVSLGLGVAALGGHLVAKAAGADVPWETIMLDERWRTSWLAKTSGCSGGSPRATTTCRTGARKPRARHASAGHRPGSARDATEQSRGPGGRTREELPETLPGRRRA